MVSEETLVGKQLDQYEVKAALGRGPVGAVYRAYQPSVNRMVAVKVLPAAFVDVPGFSSTFQQEARALARLDHPHIVPLYGIGQAEGRPYLVMRYMPGGTLAGMVERYGSLAVNELVPIVEQIGAVLDAIQRQGIVHGDLKPSNILLDEEGNAYVSDFGIPSVRKAVLETMKDRRPGPEAAYRAPEIGPTKPPTPAGDIYSLGMIAFYALCGKLPADLTLLEGASDRLDRQTVPSLHGVKQSIPEAVDEIVAAALSRDPKARYTSARDFASALRQAAGHRPPATVQPPDSTNVLKSAVPVPDHTTPPPLPSPPSLKAFDDTGSREKSLIPAASRSPRPR